MYAHELPSFDLHDNDALISILSDPFRIQILKYTNNPVAVDAFGLQTIPPSRFVNTNGLWEHSPYLNACGLVEALEIAYGSSMVLWDRLDEPLCLLHLHNLLVVRGYIKEPVGLWATLDHLFADVFYKTGTAPTRDFYAAFMERYQHSDDRRSTATRGATVRTGSLSMLLDGDTNRLYRKKSFVRMHEVRTGYLTGLPKQIFLHRHCWPWCD